MWKTAFKEFKGIWSASAGHPGPSEKRLGSLSYNNRMTYNHICHTTFYDVAKKLRIFSRKIENIQNFLFFAVLGCSNKILITTSKRGETLSKLAWKLEIDIN